MKKVIQLPDFGIEIILDGANSVLISSLKEPCPCCGKVHCFFDCDESKSENSSESEDDARSRLEINRCIDGIEAIILAAACAEIDVTTPQFVGAITTALYGISNNV